MLKLFKNIRSLRFAFSIVLIAVFGLTFLTVEASAQNRRKRVAVRSGGKVRVDENLTPVVLIHGIGGSDLRRVIPNDERAQNRNLLDDGFPHDVLKMKINPFGKATDPRNLQFDETGAPREDTASKIIQATEFYDVPFSRNITDLSKYLESQGYKKASGETPDKSATLFEFYYDFRYSVPQTALLLSDFVNRIKLQTGVAKIDLIGHSMGGVIVKQYLLNAENAKNIRTVIFAATPHLGAPKALKALRYGDDLDIGLFDECKLKRAVHNMPSMFNLLPGKRYFAVAGAGYFTDGNDSDNDGVTGELDYEHTIANLKNGSETRCKLNADGKNKDAAPFDRLSADLVRDDVENFRDAQDNWTKPDGVKVFAVAGYNVPTLKAIREDAAQMTYTYTTAGDGTVPLLSSETVDADQIYYADFKRLKTDHSQMIGTPAIDLQIFKLLQRGAGIYAPDISTARPDDGKFTTTPKVERFFKPPTSRAALKRRTVKKP